MKWFANGNVTFSRRLKADIQSVEFSEWAEILLFTREKVALKLNRYSRLSNFLLPKIPPAGKIPLTGNWPLQERSLIFPCLMYSNSYHYDYEHLKRLLLALGLP